MRRLVSGFLIALTLSCCKSEEPVYPHEQSPFIEFENLEYIDSEGVDTLSLSLIIWDREGDIGLSSDLEDLRYPYQVFSFVIDTNDELVTIKNDITPPLYTVPAFYNSGQFFADLEYRELFSESDNRPEYNCDSYEIVHNEGLDTMFVIRNEGHYNLLINFLKANGSEFNFQEIFNSSDCALGSFDARVPFVEPTPFNRIFETVNSPFRIEYVNRYARRVTYHMLGQGFKISFLNNPFELGIKVKDRELNDSNFVETGLVTLDEISVD